MPHHAGVKLPCGDVRASCKGRLKEGLFFSTIGLHQVRIATVKLFVLGKRLLRVYEAPKIAIQSEPVLGRFFW
ncbi:hypothetical protein M0804_003216 [Polistes exclamans]|nr:hypothetical protein M0804_003216 [Polistes exclamans]